MSSDYIPSVFSFVSSAQRRKREHTLETFEKRQKSKQKRVCSAVQDRNSLESPSFAVPVVNEPASAAERNFDLEDALAEEHECPSTSTLSMESVMAECQSLRNEVQELRKKVKFLSLDEEDFKDNHSKVRDLTGLPSYGILAALVATLSSFLREKSVLTPFQQVILTCMRMKCNINMQVLSYMFCTSRSTVSRVFNDVLHVMDRRLVPALIIWPDREQLRLSMPMSFRKTFRKCACIIDCFEIFIERSKDLKARAQTYSQYMSHQTIQYLIGITPQGSISFISKGWGGRVSDKYLTNHCGFLDNLVPGDLILADRGFDVADSVGLFNCTLKIPAFTRGKKQLDPVDVETTRALAAQRIHVERVIGLTRQKYTMLQSTVPITYLQSDQFNLTTLDKIVRVSCALTNLSDSVVPFE